MNTSQKIKTLTFCLDALITYDRVEIDVILDAFNAPIFTPNPWEEIELRKEIYFRIKELDFEALSQLEQHLSSEGEAVVSPSDHAYPWKTDLPTKVFLSHQNEDKVFLSEVKAFLDSNFGVEAFLAHEDIHPTKTWRDTIKNALSTADMLVAYLSPQFHQSEWCDQEVGWALGRRIPVMPVQPRQEVGRNGFMEERQHERMNRATTLESYWLAKQIYTALKDNPKTNIVATKSAVHTLKNSQSYAHTRDLWDAIWANRRILDDDDIQSMREAVANNHQVSECFDSNKREIPQLIEELAIELNPQQALLSETPPF